MLKKTLLLLGSIAFAAAQAPAGSSICDYYASSFNTTNSTDAQIKWIYRFTANVFGGNNSVFGGSLVQGVLNAGTFNGKPIRLTNYFDGSLYNVNGVNGLPTAVNWLDDGGVVTLSEGIISNSQTSNQYKLLSRFSALFARVLGCTTISAGQFVSVLNKTSLYQVHKYMSLSPDELGYFIQQVGGAALVVGLTQDEANNITTKMSTSLTFRCRPPASLSPGGPAGPQSICTDKDCPLAPNADCSAYDFDNGTSPDPALVNGAVSISSTASSTPTSTRSAVPNTSHKSNTIPIAVGVAVPVGVLAIGLIAFLIMKQRKKVKTLENRLTKIETAPPPSHGFESASFNPPSEAARSTIGGPPQHYQNPGSPLYENQSNHTSSQQFSPDMRHFSGDQSQFKPEMQEFPPQQTYSPPAAPYVQPAAPYTGQTVVSPRPRHELE